LPGRGRQLASEEVEGTHQAHVTPRENYEPSARHHWLKLMSTERHLEVVRGRGTRINDNQFRVAAQAIVEGMQDIRVEAATPLAGPGHGQIAVRVGRLLVYVNDREALDSFIDAWRRAEALADKVFGTLDTIEYRRP
jgi:hypothetical protein